MVCHCNAARTRELAAVLVPYPVGHILKTPGLHDAQAFWQQGCGAPQVQHGVARHKGLHVHRTDVIRTHGGVLVVRQHPGRRAVVGHAVVPWRVCQQEGILLARGQCRIFLAQKGLTVQTCEARFLALLFLVSRNQLRCLKKHRVLDALGPGDFDIRLVQSGLARRQLPVQLFAAAAVHLYSPLNRIAAHGKQVSRLGLRQWRFRRC